MPAWAVAAFRSAGADAGLAASGYVAPGAIPALSFTPVAAFRDAQPIRVVAFDPAARAGGANTLAIGTNSKALRLAAVGAGGAGAAAAAFDESVLATRRAGGGGGAAGALLLDLPIVHSWEGHHVGSVYCAAWAAAPGGGGAGGAGDAVLATGSNDTLVKVVRAGRAAHGGPVTTALGATVVIPAGVGTVRDVRWFGAGVAAGGAPAFLAVAGGGDGGIRVYDAAGVTPAAGGTPGATTRAPPPVVTFAGHAGTVHAVRAWGDDAAVLVSAAEDGTVRLWDARAGAAPVATLALSAGGAALAAPGAALATAAGTGGLPLHALAVRGRREVAVGCADGGVAVADVAAGRMVAVDRVHDGEVRSVDALGPLLLTSSFDGSVCVSVMTLDRGGGGGGGVLRTLAARRDHGDKALCAAWAPAAPMFASSSADKTVMVWSVGVE